MEHAQWVVNQLQWFDFFRLATSGFCIAAMYRLSHRIRENEQVYSPRLKDFIWFIYASLLAQMIGALEALTKGQPYTHILLLSFLVSVLAFRATRRSEKPLIT